jgi:DNA-directed RNA polymerase specialized sigma24 family protein
MTHSAGPRRQVDADSFARLLARLHPDSEQAAREYERLRRALVKFFDWRGIRHAEECADEVFDRLAQKLAETEVRDVSKFAYGIARLVALERQRVAAPGSIDEAAAAALLAAPAIAPDEDPLHDCFDRCLDEMPGESRSLVLRYYEGERQAKIANRRRLASALGLTENALRSRVQRLRERLEACVHSCMAQPIGRTP